MPSPKDVIMRSERIRLARLSKELDSVNLLAPREEEEKSHPLMRVRGSQKRRPMRLMREKLMTRREL